MSFRPTAWRFILEPPEKKQASRFADPAHFCVLQVSTRVNSRVRRGTEPYSTISASSAASRFPRASGSSSGLFNAEHRESGAFLSPESWACGGRAPRGDSALEGLAFGEPESRKEA